MALAVIREGFAQKEGGWPKTWKQRWFVLTPDQLCYYAKEDKEKLKGCVERSTVTDVRLGEHPKRPLIVQMEAVDRKKRNRTFNFSFSSATERLEWLQVLRVWAGVDSVASPSTMKRLPTLQNTLNEVSRGREESVDDQRSTNSEGPLEKKKASDESACDSAMDPSAILHEEAEIEDMMEALRDGTLSKEDFDRWHQRQEALLGALEVESPRNSPSPPPPPPPPETADASRPTARVQVDLSPSADSSSPQPAVSQARAPPRKGLSEEEMLREAKALRDRLLHEDRKFRSPRPGLKSPIQELCNIRSTSQYDLIRNPKKEGKHEWELSLLRIDYAQDTMDCALRPQLTSAQSVKNLHAPTPTNTSSRRLVDSGSPSSPSAKRFSPPASPSAGGPGESAEASSKQSPPPLSGQQGEAVFDRLNSSLTDSVRAGMSLTRQQSAHRLAQESLRVSTSPVKDSSKRGSPSSGRKSGSRACSSAMQTGDSSGQKSKRGSGRVVSTPPGVNNKVLEGPSLQQRGLVEDSAVEVLVAGCRTKKKLTQAQARRKQQEEEQKRQEQAKRRQKDLELQQARAEFRERAASDHALSLYKRACEYKRQQLAAKYERHFSFSPRTNWNRPKSSQEAARFAVSDGRSPTRQSSSRPQSAPQGKSTSPSSGGRSTAVRGDVPPVAEPLRANSSTSIDSSVSSDRLDSVHSRGVAATAGSSSPLQKQGSHLRERTVEEEEDAPNSHGKGSSSSPSIHERLYKHGLEKISRQKKFAQQERERLQAEELKAATHKPVLFTQDHVSPASQRSSLTERLQSYQEERRLRLERLRKELKEQEEAGMTFTPQLWEGSDRILRQTEARERELLALEEAEYRRKMEEKMMKIQQMEEERQILLSKSASEEGHLGEGIPGESQSSASAEGTTPNSMRVKEALHSNKYSLQVLEEEEAILERINKLALEEIVDPREKFQSKRFMFGPKNRFEHLYEQARVHREQLQKKREAVARENSFSPQIGRPPRRAVHSSIGYRSGGGFMGDGDSLDLAELSHLPQEQRDWLLENASMGQGLLNDEKILRYLMLCDLDVTPVGHEDLSSMGSSQGSAPSPEQLQSSALSTSVDFSPSSRKDSTASLGSSSEGAGTSRSSPSLADLRRNRTYSRVGQLNMIVQANSAPIPQLQDIAGDEVSSLSSRQSVQKELEDLHKRSLGTILSPEKQREELALLTSSALPHPAPSVERSDDSSSSSPSGSSTPPEEDAEADPADTDVDVERVSGAHQSLGKEPAVEVAED